MWFRHRRARSVSALAVAVLSVTSACSADREEESLIHADSLVIAVKEDQPRLGDRGEDGELEGYDVDVARYIADYMGIEDVEFIGTTSARRDGLLARPGPGGSPTPETDPTGTPERADMVVATYSITPERKTRVTFAGPYYVAKQDILVRADDDEVFEARDLEGRTICQGEGSYSTSRITAGLGIDVREESKIESYSRCIELLAEGEVDAVSTDNLILAGFMTEYPGEFRLVNNPFTDEKYGVGLPYGDVAACERVNEAISTMYRDGTAEELFEKWFEGTGIEEFDENGEERTYNVPQFEGCE
ncbi:transporter substrate-binding domain-containing protein [Nocardiopsis alba]|uniref:Transporter substrate-binding domain-containing protein n=1 Tax=Nocardiopsis alba TaxID=53437 RepID=A0A7K2IU24_9ACTN|nr:transporter substrate-binding domain-containing protein [Nocardiopsis alba]MYR33295.1 transporter substrate-binding domain-containing protein [Nocardiopsis alba]